MNRETIVVGIAGGTGSGKSVVTNALVEQIGLSLVQQLRLDWYYHDLSHIKPLEREHINFDHPRAIDFASLISDVRSLASGESVLVPRYSFTTHTRTGRTECIPKRMLIIEGLFALWNPILRKEYDCSIFIEADSDVRLARRLHRDVYELGLDVTPVIARYFNECKPMYTKHIEPTREYADLVVINHDDIDSIVQQIRRLIDVTRARRRPL